MVTKVDSWRASDGSLHPTAEEAQQQEVFLSCKKLVLGNMMSTFHSSLDKPAYREALYKLADTLNETYNDRLM